MFKNGKIKIDNTDAYYIKFGKGKKNLIIIPGIGDGLKTVKGLALPFSIMYKTFSKDYTVYVFSRRNKMPEGFTIEDMAKDIIQHMKDLNIEESDIVGVSQGGMIAQQIAIQAPKKVGKLVLAVTCPRPNEIMTNSINNWKQQAQNKDYKGIMEDTAEKSYVGKYLEKNRKFYKFLGLFGKNKPYERFIIECDSVLNHNTYDKLDKIKNDTLIIGAGQDKALGIIGSKELNEKIKNSKLYIYEEYSHGVYEQAKDFNDRILKFLKGE